MNRATFLRSILLTIPGLAALAKLMPEPKPRRPKTQYVGEYPITCDCDYYRCPHSVRAYPYEIGEWRGTYWSYEDGPNGPA